MKRFILSLFIASAGGCRSNAVEVGYEEPPPDGTIVTCPVSHETCAKTPLTRAAVYEMRTYYFCRDDAPRRFAAEPERFVAKR